MAIKKPIPITFNLDSRQSVQSVCAVIHIDDNNTETLDLSLMQGGEHIAVSPNSTVTARFVRVKDKILISDNVACTVQENGNIHIPIDNAAAHMLVGEIKIEVNIVDENDILTMQFPLVIRVNNTILADAEISPESEGTIPELLEEAREAAEDAAQAAEAATEAISTKQDKLTAGQNITITEENVISASSGSNDYTELENKPSINNVTLSGNKSSDDLSLQGKLTAGNNITIEGNVISAEGGGVTSYEDLTDKPTVTVDNQTNTLSGALVFDYFEFTRTLLGSNGVALSNVIFKSFFDIYFTTPYDFAQLSENYIHTGCFYELKNRAQNIPVEFSDATSEFYIFNFGERYTPYEKLVRVVTYSTTSEIKTFIQFYSVDYNYEVTNASAWQQIGGGSQIVSGVVNANGTITFTDSEGNSFTTSGSNLVTSSNEQISMGYDEGGFYFLFDDGQEEVNNGTN